MPEVRGDPDKPTSHLFDARGIGGAQSEAIPELLQPHGHGSGIRRWAGVAAPLAPVNGSQMRATRESLLRSDVFLSARNYTSPVPFYVYILSNKAGTVLYTGVTRDLPRRVHEHREKLIPEFSSRYSVNRLVYYEVADEALAAFERESR